jgi:hypothetical protein
MFVCMLAALVYYIQLQIITNNISNDVLESGGELNVNLRVRATARVDGRNVYSLQSAVLIHDNFDICQALAMFLAIVKVVQSMKINRRIGFVVTALSSAIHELLGFGVFFAVVYMAFCR